MQKDYTHITVILDRTGSMESIRDDTIGGFNSFLEAQQKLPGTATMTLVQFDSQDPYEVICHFRPVIEVPKLTREVYVPRSTTPLLDAIGRGINDLDAALAKLHNKDRPSKVIMAIVTDGQENASREFTKAQVTKLIDEKTQKHDWQFVFLSADLAASADAEAYGIGRHANLAFVKDAQGTQAAWDALSCNTAEYRCNKKKKIGFTVGDRKHPRDPAR